MAEKEPDKQKHHHLKKYPNETGDEQAERERLLDASEISLVLDTYDDIFSDFDPRPYDHRSLSQDFLTESKRAARDKMSGLALKFLIPKAMKDENKEELIELRLREHFEKHSYLTTKEISKSRLLGAVLTISGMLITIVAAVTAFYFRQALWAEIVVVVLEPAGWFAVWNGLDMTIFAVRGKEADLEFYDKMQDAEITFEAY